MLESLEKAAAVVPMVRDATDVKSFDASVKAFSEAVKHFESAWKSRTAMVTGTKVM